MSEQKATATALISPEDMARGALLVEAGRNWLSLTAEDIDRGARAVVRDCTYRREVAQTALRYAEDIRNPDLGAALRDAWDRLNETPCVCTRTDGRTEVE